nr:retrovirus-related Pol polyprotein from transposon TNT 1-94 [Tanacetum cinerariifolium]
MRLLLLRPQQGHPQQALKNKRIVDSGCSRNMTGNKAYLADYQEINDGCFVVFGSSRGKSTSKGEAAQSHLALVTNSHNKTPYEILNGRTPTLDFMRPFDCPVIILNTLDPLGKFEDKDDEGFLVGYSITSKAFRKIWLRVQQMMKGSDIGIQEKKAKLFNEWESRHVTIVHQTKDLHTADFTQLYDFLKYNQKEVDELKAKRLAKTQDPLALMANSNNPYAFPAPHQDQPSIQAKLLNTNQQQSPTNNNQRVSSNLRNRQIVQPGMNMGQDRQMQMVRGNGGNQFRQYAGHNARNLARYNDVIWNQVIQNAVQNPRVQN